MEVASQVMKINWAVSKIVSSYQEKENYEGNMTGSGEAGVGVEEIGWSWKTSLKGWPIIKIRREITLL